MSVRDGLKSTQHPCVFYKTHPTRKHGIKFDRQWIVRQTLGKRTRVSVIGWSSENVKLTDALRAADEFRANHKRNIANPHLPPLPICTADYIRTVEKKESEYPLFADFAERFIKPTSMSGKSKNILSPLGEILKSSISKEIKS